MPSNSKNNAIRAGIPVYASCVKCPIQRKWLISFEDLNRFGIGRAWQRGLAVGYTDDFHRAAKAAISKSFLLLSL